MSTSEIFAKAPRYITQRYGSLRSYMWQEIFPSARRTRHLTRLSYDARRQRYDLMRNIIDEATLLAFVFVTRRTFTEGSKAAKQAVDTLAQLGIDEFYLGSARFSGRNENVVLGDMLAEQLWNALDQDARDLLNNTRYISGIIDRYRAVAREYGLPV